MASRNKLTARDVAYMGVLAALAVIMAYVEYRIPINIGIPGIKLGLSNIVIVFTLYFYGPLGAAAVALVKVLVMGLLFGNFISALYSLAGAALSLIVMIILKKTGKFSCFAVSAAGGMFHNVGQILTAALILRSASVFYLLPILMAVGELTGAVIGILAQLVLKRLKPASV